MRDQPFSDRRFIVIYDTYCGWCYGAGPVFDALVASGADVEPLHRHLFEGVNVFRMSEGKGAAIMQADRQIATLSGQPFSQVYIDNVVRSGTEVLESGYSAQAAALVHGLGVEQEFAVRRRLEHARYVGGVSAADRAAVVAALVAEGLNPLDAARIGSPELIEQTARIAARAASLMNAVGSHGVPTVLEVRDGTVDVFDHTPYLGRPEAILSQTA